MDSQKYIKSFYEMIRSRFNRDVDFTSIEKGLEHIRNGDALTYADLELIADERYWPFEQYWMWPPREQIEEKLKVTAGKFKDLYEKDPKEEYPNEERDEERELIRFLSEIFKNLSLVSIIMRFVHPEHNAIYSRPNLKILRVERGEDDVEEYMNYIQVMRLLKGSFGVERVADVDIIVWAIAKQEQEPAEFLKVLAEQLPENLTPGELFNNLADDPLRIAKVYLRKEDYKTSGFWASQAFEISLRDEYSRLIGYPRRKDPEKGELQDIIDQLATRPEYQGWSDYLHSLRWRRNKAIHPSYEFTKVDAEALIDGAGELKQKVEAAKNKKILRSK
jgi:HEPN domain-containing protein